MEQRLIRELELVFVINTQRFQGPMNQIKTALQAITVLMNTLKKSTQDWLLTLNTAVGKAVKVSVGGMQARAPGNVETLGLSAASIANMKARTMELNVITKLINAEKGYEAAVNRTTKAQREAAAAERLRAKEARDAARIAAAAEKTRQREWKNSVRELNRATRAQHNLTRETMGGIRVFGTQGFLGAIALVRNHLLLLAFALGSVGVAMRSVLAETKEAEMALAGLGSAATGYNHNTKQVMEMAQKYADTGLITLKESATTLRNLLTMEGVGTELADKAMAKMLDWAAFNRMGQYSIGQALEIGSQGLKEQRAQTSDTFGWLTNLNRAWQEYAGTLGTTMGKLDNAQKNVGSLTMMIKEGFVVSGNAAKAASLYGGKLVELGVAARNFKKELGEGLVGVLQGAATEMIKMYKGFAEYLRINKDIIALNVGKEFQSLGRTITGIITGVFNLVKGFAQFYSQHSTFIKSMAIAAIVTKGLDLAMVKLAPKILAVATSIDRLVKALQFYYVVAGGFNKEFFTFVSAMKNFKVVALIAAAAAITAVVYAMLKFRDVLQKQMTAQRDAIIQDMRETRSQIEVTTALKKHNEEMNDYYTLLESKGKLTDTQSEQFDKVKKSISGLNTELDGLLEKLTQLEFKKALEDINLGVKKTTIGAGKMSFLESLKYPTGNEALEAQSQSYAKLQQQEKEYLITSKDIAELDNYRALSIDEQNKKIQEYTELLFNARSTNSIYTNQIQELLNVFIKFRKEIPGQLKDGVGEVDEAMKNWLSTLEKINDEIAKMTLSNSAYSMYKLVKQLQEYETSMKAAGQDTKENRGILDIWFNLKQAEMVKTEAEKWQKDFADMTDKYNQKIREDEDNVLKDRLARYKDFIQEAQDLATRAGESDLGKSGWLQKLGLVPSDKSMYEAVKDMEQLKANYKNQLSFGEITPGQYNAGMANIKKLETKEIEKIYQEHNAALMQQQYDLMQNTVGNFFNERELLKQNKQSELQDIMSAYQQQLISHEEMVARKLKVEEDYHRKIRNLENQTKKDIINTAINTAGQYLQTWISTYVAQQQAKRIAEGVGGMSAGIGALVSVGAGLAIGAGLALLSYAATKKYRESDTTSYQPISASGQSDSERKRFGGIAGASIQYLNIIPTISFSNIGDTYIAAGSITSFAEEMSSLIEQSVQSSIDEGRISLDGVSPK